MPQGDEFYDPISYWGDQIAPEPLRHGGPNFYQSRVIYSILDEVFRERTEQVARWGQQNHSPLRWLPILAEECGEVAKEVADERIQEFNGENYRRELIQTAAVAVAAIEAWDRVGLG